jgi:F420-dependent oxidoreductase-like protein
MTANPTSPTLVRNPDAGSCVGVYLEIGTVLAPYSGESTKDQTNLVDFTIAPALVDFTIAQAGTAAELGIRDLMRQVIGAAPDQQVAHLREFLTALRPLLDTGDVDFAGELVTARTPFPSAVPGARPAPPILVAAMGPKALRVAGELADGTLPYLAGPKTLADFLVPTITEAADAVGRPRPRVVALVPGVVTDNVSETRARAYREMEFYESVPSYRAVLAREGVERAGDLAVIGSAEQLTEEIHRCSSQHTAIPAPGVERAGYIAR